MYSALQAAERLALKARQQRGELHRTLKSLDTASLQLEHINGELIQARATANAALNFKKEFITLTRPALATVAIVNMIKIWNDFWFPLIFGQYHTDWTRALSTLSLAALPILLLYVLLSRDFIKGLTAGAVKG